MASLLISCERTRSSLSATFAAAAAPPTNLCREPIAQIVELVAMTRSVGPAVHISTSCGPFIAPPTVTTLFTSLLSAMIHTMLCPASL